MQQLNDILTLAHRHPLMMHELDLLHEVLLDGGGGADLLITGSLPNETSSWTSVASTTTYNPVTYFNPAASDAALLTLLAQWSLSNDNSGALGIQHDGANDDVFGSTGDDEPPGITIFSLRPPRTPPASSSSVANGVPIGIA